MKRFKSSVDIDGALTVGGQPVVGGGGAGAIASSIVDAKGDLIVGTAVDTVNRLAAGTDGQVLSADSAEVTGLKWVDANFTGGGGGSAASGASVTLTTPQNVAHNDETVVLWESQLWGEPNYWSSGSPDKISFPDDGRYIVTGNVSMTMPSSTSNSDNQYFVSIKLYNSNDTLVRTLAYVTGWSSWSWAQGPVAIVDATAGQYVKISAYQNEGATQTFTGQASVIKITDTGTASTTPNLLHNPAFEIWQRGTGSTSCPADARTFLADRWFVRPSGAAVTQQQSISVPSGSFARYSLQIDGAASVTTVDVAQRVEAANVPAMARTVTFSWRVYNGTGASLTPSLLIGTPAASDVFTTVTNRVTQSLQACADAAWTTVSHTVDISGYTDLANGMEIALQFPSGSVVAGDTVRITEAQVTATNGIVGFNRPGVKNELEECQRYFWRWQSNDGTEVIGLSGVSTSTDHTYFFGIQLPTTMRTVPIVSTNGLDAFRTGFGYFPLNNGVAPDDWNSTTTLAPTLTRVSGTWGGMYPVFLAIQAPVAGKYLDADAEL